MPRQTKPARRCAPQQVDLFAATADDDRRHASMVWAANGEQAALTNLMTRLILEHADKNGSAR